MNTHRHIHISARALAPVILTSSLIACGSSDLTSIASEPASDRVVTRGTVRALDIVSVNDRFFSVSGASIFMDDQAVEQTALRTGMQVIVQHQSGAASSIHYEEDVKGPVEAVDAIGNLFVMGQLVLISSRTLFDHSSNSVINVGDIVEVSGLRDNNNSLHATYVEKKLSTPAAYQVQGAVGQLNAVNQTFVIGDLVVDYSEAHFDDFSEPSLANGVPVEVKDENLLYEPGSLFLRATRIERYRDVLSVSSGPATIDNAQRTEVEVEAFVTDIVSDNVIKLNNLNVRISPATHFRDGERRHLQIGLRLEAEGWLNSEGELEAWEIEFEDNSGYFDSDESDYSVSQSSSDGDDFDIEVEIEGVVTAMNVNDGLFVIKGIEVRIDNRTEFENRQDQTITRNQFFDLIDIGSTVLKVKWKRFNSYTDAPHEVDIEV